MLNVADNGNVPRRGGVESSYRPDETPISSSAVVIRRSSAKDAQGRRHRVADGEHSYALTPYQARLDVAMDDTAVSKVRDPSVSIRLGAEELRRSARKSVPSMDAIAPVALGTLIGAVLVMLAVFAVRALGH